MIHGNYTPQQDELIIVRLFDSNIEFYLTGSRQFGEWTIKSDYDLFVQYSKRVENFLNKLGFIRFDKKDCKYSDNNLHSLWQLGNVQVQVQKDAQRKLEIQQWITRAGFRFATDKSLRRKQWDYLYDNCPKAK